MKEEFKKEIENLSPSLAKLKARKSAEKPELPPNFFHNMQVEVLNELRPDFQETKQSEKHKAHSSNLWFNFLSFLRKPQVSLAFSAGLILIAVGIFFKNNFSEKPVIIAALTDEEILEYIDSNLDDFDAVSLLEISDDEIYLENDLDEDEVNQFLEENLDQFDDSDFENLF